MDFRNITDEDLAALKSGRLIVVQQSEIRGDKSRTLYDAPRSVAVHRLEVYEQIEREKREAVSKSAKPTQNTSG